MSVNVVCLRPEADFTRVDAPAPAALTVHYRAPTDADMPALLKTAQALVIPAVGPKLPSELFAGTALKLVQVTGAGVDRVEPETMKRHGIPVANVPGGSNSAVAEYCVTSAATLLRRLAWADREIKAGRYQAFRTRMLADNIGGLEGLLVGIVGLGTVGAAVAELFSHFGCRLCYFDPSPAKPDAATRLGAKAMTLDELLASADVVSLHLPLLPATKGLIGTAQFARMKTGAVLVQASRGGIVDEAALVAALESGKLAGAAVDVYSTEPPGADNPLFALSGDARERVLFAPHIAGVTRQSAAFLFRAAWENVQRTLIGGEAPRHRVF